MDYFGLCKLGKATYMGLKQGKYGMELAKVIAKPFLTFCGATFTGLIVEELIGQGIELLEEKIYDSY